MGVNSVVHALKLAKVNGWVRKVHGIKPEQGNGWIQTVRPQRKLEDLSRCVRIVRSSTTQLTETHSDLYNEYDPQHQKLASN